MTSCLDGITLAITANFELNQRRREAIRPHFKSEFAKGLCSTTSPGDEFLFGGDTATLNKHKVCKGPTTTSFEGEVRDTIRILAEDFEVVLFVVKAIVVKLLNINFNSAKIFRMRPSPIERRSTRSPIATGMLIY